MRAALVDYFRDEAAIMIATEAAAEGINLQFCNLVVNYDLPWNPQRIEQRIGRCHRYGQKFDVVVVNFLNKSNAADLRVYQLLAEKFRLFSGVFGASDEVIGAVESGVDFEKRIAGIYQKCRTPEQIQFGFDALQRDLETEIAEGQRDACEKLLNNFDQDVVEKVRIQAAIIWTASKSGSGGSHGFCWNPMPALRNGNIASRWSETLSHEKPSILAPIAWGRTSKTPTLTGLAIPWHSVSSHKPRRCPSNPAT